MKCCEYGPWSYDLILRYAPTCSVPYDRNHYDASKAKVMLLLEL
jgi:hypothetical protein